MTEQTICNPVLLISVRILESLTFLISGKALGNLTKFDKEFVSKNYHAQEKKKSRCKFQTRCKYDWIKFFCYSSDKEFRIIDKG